MNRILLTIGNSLQEIARTVTIILQNRYFEPSLFALLGFMIFYLIAGIFTDNLGSKIVLSCCFLCISILVYRSRKAPVSQAEGIYRKIQNLMHIGKYSTAIRFINENIEVLNDEDLKNDGYYKRIIHAKAICYYELYMASEEQDKRSLLYAIKEYERCAEYFNADDYHMNIVL